MRAGRWQPGKKKAAGGLREQDAVPRAIQGAMGGGVRCPRCTGGSRRRVRSSEPTLAARSGERGEQLSGGPDTLGLIKVTELERG